MDIANNIKFYNKYIKYKMKYLLSSDDYLQNLSSEYYNKNIEQQDLLYQINQAYKPYKLDYQTFDFRTSNNNPLNINYKMSIIANFLWLGDLKLLPQEYIDNIHKWQKMKKNINCILWCDDFDENNKQLSKIKLINIKELKPKVPLSNLYKKKSLSLQIEYLKNIILLYNTYLQYDYIIFTDFKTIPDNIFNGDNFEINFSYNYKTVSYNTNTEHQNYEKSLIIIKNTKNIQNKLLEFVQKVNEFLDDNVSNEKLIKIFQSSFRIFM